MAHLKETPAWRALVDHHGDIGDRHMLDLFADDATRFDTLSLEAAGLFIDFSKNRITPGTLRLLCDLAEEAGVPEAIDDMFTGRRLNTTEDRAVLHVALRNPASESILLDGDDVMPDVLRERAKMAHIAETIHRGEWTGFGGAPIRDVVHIGIGGSDLGPRMITRALRPYRGDRVNVHFVANLDATEITETLVPLRPATTLFIIASKTFTTLETMINAHTARTWLVDGLGTDRAVARHFVALSSNLRAVAEFGIDKDSTLEFWDWVGGRFSLWSVIGLPIAIAVGMKHFEELLAGAHEMDRHFRGTDLARNLPVVLALIGIWYRNFFDTASHAVLPYDESLRWLAPYLQQAEMESNGKSVDLSGGAVDVATAPVIWGGQGSNGQHAFFQMLHQGTDLIPVDCIAPIRSHNPQGAHHEHLVANCLAQSEALLRGRSAAQVRAALAAAGLDDEELARQVPHRVTPGNRPSTTLLMDQLTPHTLGALVALYEHKIFVQGRIWRVNSFDQFGVELGKALAAELLPDLAGGHSVEHHDGSTRGLIARYRDQIKKQ